MRSPVQWIADGIGQLDADKVGQAILLVACFLAGYFIAGWRTSARDMTAVERICARVSGLVELHRSAIEDRAAREEFDNLNVECRSAAPRNRPPDED